MDLLQQCIRTPWAVGDETGGDETAATKALRLLDDLEPGRHITGEDLLDLMELCVNKDTCDRFGERQKGTCE